MQQSTFTQIFSIDQSLPVLASVKTRSAGSVPVLFRLFGVMIGSKFEFHNSNLITIGAYLTGNNLDCKTKPNIGLNITVCFESPATPGIVATVH